MNTKELNQLIKTHVNIPKHPSQSALHYIEILRQTSLIHDALVHLTTAMSHISYQMTLPHSKFKMEKHDALVLTSSIYEYLDEPHSGDPMQTRTLIAHALKRSIPLLHGDLRSNVQALYNDLCSSSVKPAFTIFSHKYYNYSWFTEFMTLLGTAWNSKHIDVKAFQTIHEYAEEAYHNDCKFSLSTKLCYRLEHVLAHSDSSHHINLYLAGFYETALLLANQRDEMYAHLYYKANEVKCNPCAGSQLQENIFQTTLDNIKKATAYAQDNQASKHSHRALKELCPYIKRLLKVWPKVIHYTLTTRSLDSYDY